MDGYSISQVAERTGFSTSTLRFYEQEGLVRPDRTPAGYRCYDDHDVELLAFIGRAKGFGLTLEEVAELLALLDDDRCAPVQGRLRDLVDAKIADAQARIAELVGFTAELQRVSATLAVHTPDGPCDDACGCTRDQRRVPVVGVALTAGQERSGPPIACTLASDLVPDRVTDWQATLAGAAGREAIDGGARVHFGSGADVAELAALAAAEQECCRFFTFALTVGPDGVTFDVTGPDEARPVIDALLGVPA